MPSKSPESKLYTGATEIRLCWMALGPETVSVPCARHRTAHASSFPGFRGGKLRHEAGRAASLGSCSEAVAEVRAGPRALLRLVPAPRAEPSLPAPAVPFLLRPQTPGGSEGRVWGVTPAGRASRAQGVTWTNPALTSPSSLPPPSQNDEDDEDEDDEDEDDNDSEGSSSSSSSSGDSSDSDSN
ncbi:hypothetical protein DV515_00016554 [Chloebia gouldiae]|uniref:Uncharacterized protein n=1 Tax=Chloebia gouldiae TaxID=44316 RepID=A0A3L8RRQ6_CHLGU|nr:hypothetical protein DV515_00016553 [Chloebia gouldiae]RLV82877.1 hypothetical protein DV515_00016554 [Chloebia gouldiae]